MMVNHHDCDVPVTGLRQCCVEGRDTDLGHEDAAWLHCACCGSDAAHTSGQGADLSGQGSRPNLQANPWRERCARLADRRIHASLEGIAEAGWTGRWISSSPPAVHPRSNECTSIESTAVCRWLSVIEIATGVGLIQKIDQVNALTW